MNWSLTMQTWVTSATRDMPAGSATAASCATGCEDELACVQPKRASANNGLRIHFMRAVYRRDRAGPRPRIPRGECDRASYGYACRCFEV